MKLPSLGFLCLFLCACFLNAEELSQAEAHSILRLALKSERVVGSFSSSSTRETSTRTRQITTLTKCLPDGHEYFRKVQVDTRKHGSRSKETRVTVKNESGVWDLFPKDAILMPSLLSPEKMAECQEAVRVSKATGSDEPLRKVIADNPLLKGGMEIAQHMHWTGEKLQTDRGPCVRVIESLDAEGQKLLLKLAKEQMAEMKKSLPFAIRLIATPMMAMMDLGAMLPVRTEYLISADSCRLISKKRFNVSGEALPTQEAPVRVVVPELPDETFAVPAGLTLHRPNTLGDYLALRTQLQKTTKSSSKEGASKEKASKKETDGEIEP